MNTRWTTAIRSHCCMRRLTTPYTTSLCCWTAGRTSPSRTTAPGGDTTLNHALRPGRTHGQSCVAVQLGELEATPYEMWLYPRARLRAHGLAHVHLPRHGRLAARRRSKQDGADSRPAFLWKYFSKLFCRFQNLPYLCNRKRKRIGSIAQLNRASDYGSEGYRFESCWVTKRKAFKRKFERLSSSGLVNGFLHIASSKKNWKTSFSFVTALTFFYLCSQIHK